MAYLPFHMPPLIPFYGPQPSSFYSDWNNWCIASEYGRGLHQIPRGTPQTSVETSASSEDKGKFRVMINVKQFEPGELSVVTQDNYIIVRGKHEEIEDEHGYIAREFKRRYVMPSGMDPKTVTASYASHGVLTIEAVMKTVGSD